MDLGLKNKTAIVMASSAGLGKAIATEFVKKDYWDIPIVLRLNTKHKLFRESFKTEGFSFFSIKFSLIQRIYGILFIFN